MKAKKYADGGELPQDKVDRLARESNLQEREMIAGPIRSFGKRLYENVMGTEAQNKKARDEMRKMDEKAPESTQAKINKALGMKNGGKVSSASKRADGVAQRGKTRGMIR